MDIEGERPNRKSGRKINIYREKIAMAKRKRNGNLMPFRKENELGTTEGDVFGAEISFVPKKMRAAPMRLPIAQKHISMVIPVKLDRGNQGEYTHTPNSPPSFQPSSTKLKNTELLAAAFSMLRIAACCSLIPGTAAPLGLPALGQPVSRL